MAEKKRVDLRSGNITRSLIALALPLMGMSLIQMAYNLIDMFWIGRLGAGPVASVGTGGLLIWLATGIHTLAQLGGQVYVAQNLGREDRAAAGRYASAAIWMSVAISLVLGLCFTLGRTPIIAFFKLNEGDVVLGAEQYIAIAGGLIVFQLVAKLLTALITTTGDSRSPFVATAVGLAFNIIVDPILIFGWFGLPALGIIGAAIATVLAQGVVLLILIRSARKNSYLFEFVSLRALPQKECVVEILQLGAPVAAQATFFPMVAIVVSRMVAAFGDGAVAVQRIGSQVESLSWMTTEGFAIAVNSFIAQNYGAGDFHRAKEGYFRAMTMLCCLGGIATAVLIFGAEPIFQVFIDDPVVVEMGRVYMVVLGISQLFLCVEILSNSAMNAFGRTLAPAIVIILGTAIRIPVAAVLSQTSLGLAGIWWSVTLSTTIKGVCLVAMTLFFLRRGVFVQGEHPL